MRRVPTVAAFTLLSLVLAQAERGTARVQPSTVNVVDTRGQLADKSAQVDALFAPWTHGRTPGAAVLVVQDGKIVHKNGYGLADIALPYANTRRVPWVRIALIGVSTLLLSGWTCGVFFVSCHGIGQPQIASLSPPVIPSTVDSVLLTVEGNGVTPLSQIVWNSRAAAD